MLHIPVSASMFFIFCIAYIEGVALKSCHLKNFLNNFYPHEPIAIKLEIIVGVFIVSVFT